MDGWRDRRFEPLLFYVADGGVLLTIMANLHLRLGVQSHLIRGIIMKM